MNNENEIILNDGVEIVPSETIEEIKAATVPLNMRKAGLTSHLRSVKLPRENVPQYASPTADEIAADDSPLPDDLASLHQMLKDTESIAPSGSAEKKAKLVKIARLTKRIFELGQPAPAPRVTLEHSKALTNPDVHLAARIERLHNLAEKYPVIGEFLYQSNASH